jgi:hypothetical protein
VNEQSEDHEQPGSDAGTERGTTRAAAEAAVARASGRAFGVGDGRAAGLVGDGTLPRICGPGGVVETAVFGAEAQVEVELATRGIARQLSVVVAGQVGARDRSPV